MRVPSTVAGIVWTIACVLLPPALAQSSSSADQPGSCRENATEVLTSGKNFRIRNYLCETSAGARIRVQLHRVSDAVADAIIQNTLPDALRPVLGNAKLIPNPVSILVADLFDRFGESRRNHCEKVDQFAPEGQQASINNSCEGSGAVDRRMLHVGAGDDLPAASDMTYMLQKNALPSTYTKIPSQHLKLNGWRWMTGADLEDLDTKIKTFNALASRAGQKLNIDNVIKPTNGIRLLQHVAGGRLPKSLI